MVLLPAGKILVWRQLDDLFIVYQPSSAETHIFNETSALILAGLESGPRTRRSTMDWVARRLGISADDINTKEFSSAVSRLEELGLVDCTDDPVVASE